MNFSDFLAQEWKPALGCTEPASIAYAAATAAQLVSGDVREVHLTCDPRIYKNCYAVGIPHSERKVGLKWALAIGAFLPDPGLKLECFKQITPTILDNAQGLIDRGAVTIDVDRTKTCLFVSCRIRRAAGEARAVIEDDHTRLILLERNGDIVPLDVGTTQQVDSSMRSTVAGLSFPELCELARSLSDRDREALRHGAQLNCAIAEHGLTLLPRRFVDMAREDPLTRASRLVCSGVYARMCGEDFTVMSLAGSGNKGITCAVPLTRYGGEAGNPQERIDEALALACLVTSSTTHQLGALSAVCGCSNAAGIGLAAGVVHLEGGGAEEVSHAITNMVGNVTGMICDGAKIGCALKTMTSVDAAFRSASLSLSGIHIPLSDGIVGSDGAGSLKNLGRIATTGMVSVDDEILSIMQEKLK